MEDKHNQIYRIFLSKVNQSLEIFKLNLTKDYKKYFENHNENEIREMVIKSAPLYY
jgi:hypothetical protein